MASVVERLTAIVVVVGANWASAGATSCDVHYCSYLGISIPHNNCNIITLTDQDKVILMDW
jgi:hypothetical protein